VICVRSEKLSGTQQHKLNSSLQEFVCKQANDSFSCGALNDIIHWIIENFPSCIDDSFSADKTSNCAMLQADKEDFSRLWIYSHHIYNRNKRRMIIDTARQLELTGFSAPGKPGVICVEGNKSNVDKFWQQIRSLQWQHMTVRHREDFASSADVDSLRHFLSFEEKCFVNEHSGSGHGSHLDRGQLLQFLQQNGCKDVFWFYFGIDGKQDSSAEK